MTTTKKVCRRATSLIVKKWRGLLSIAFAVTAVSALGAATSGGTPTFSVTVWRGETAYVPIPKGAEFATLSLTQFAPYFDGVSIGVAYCDDVVYATQPDGKDTKSRPDVVRSDSGVKRARKPTFCIVTAAPNAKPGRKSFWPLEVTVLDRELPKPSKRRYCLDLWQHPWAIARHFKVKPFSGIHYVKMGTVFRKLAECGVKTLTTTISDLPWNHQYKDGFHSMVGRKENGDGSWSFDYSVFDRYVTMGRMYGIGPEIACYAMCPWGDMATWRGADGKERRAKLLPGTPEFERYWSPFLVDFAAYLKAKGWLGDTYIALDERTPDEVRAVAELVRRTAPGLKIYATGNRKASDFDGIGIDCYSQSLKHLDKDCLAMLPARREKGMKTTIYVCGAESRPNALMSGSDDEAFWLGAYPAMAGFDGFTFRAANAWPEDPYKDASYDTKRRMAGDTFLVYPNGEPSARLIALKAGVVAAEKIWLMCGEGDDASRAATRRKAEDIVARYGYCGARQGAFDFAAFRREVESLASMPAAPVDDGEVPVELTPIQETPDGTVRDDRPEHAHLTRNVKRLRGAPFYEALFLPGSDALPPGGRRAVAFEARERFGGIMTPYWEQDLLSDFDTNAVHFLYRAMALRTKPWMRKRAGLDPKTMAADAYRLYEGRRAKENPLVAAELASAIAADAKMWDRALNALAITNLCEDIVRAAADPAMCNSNNVDLVANLVEQWGAAENELLLEQMEVRAAEVDPWLIEYLRGRTLYRKAWNTRGTGYAATVTKDGWDGYEKTIWDAEVHLRKAFVLRPDIPASAARLVQLENPSATEGERESWYRAGIAACPDSYSLRFSHLFHLTSRWGGSPELMLDELDRIAPADGDYATRIPAMNVSLRLRSLSRLESDVRNLDTRELFFKEKSVREKTLRIIREYMKPGSSLWLESPRDRDDILCDFTSAAYSCGDYPLMVDCWRRITPGIWKRRFDAGYASDRVFAYEGQTMYTRLPFLLEQARYPKRFAALGKAYAELDGGDVTNAVAALSRTGNAAPAGSRARGQFAEDVWRALYRHACEDGARVSMMDDLLTCGDVRWSACGRMVPLARDVSRTSFRTCDEWVVWYSTKGVMRDFTGTTEFTAKPTRAADAKSRSGGAFLEFYLGAPSLEYGQRMPVLRIERVVGATNDWNVSVWENTGERDMRRSAYFDPTPRQLVKSRHVACGTDGIRVRADIHNGRMTLSVNGETITPQPLDFALDGENGWYPFNFRQQYMAVTEHWLDATPEARARAQGRCQATLLPRFASQNGLVPLPTMDYVTNEVVRAAAESGARTFPEMSMLGPWWSVKFNSSEIEEMRPAVLNGLEVALTNEVWAAMPDAMRGPLALRFAALAHQAGDLGLAAEYIVRYVPKELIENPQALAVPDMRYDDAVDPGKHGRDLRTRLWGDCSPLRAAWWRACRSEGPVDAADMFGNIRSLPVVEEDGTPRQTGFGLPCGECWRLSIRAKGPFRLFPAYTDGFVKGRPREPSVIVEERGDGTLEAVAVPNGSGRDHALGEAARLSRAADGTYAVEYVCRGGRLEVFAGGTKIGSAEPGPGAGFAPAWLADPGRSVVRVTLERLRPPVSDGGAPFDADAFIQRILKMSKNTSRDEMRSLEKTVRDNGKAVAEAVAVRLADKSAKEEDKVKYVCLLGLAKQDSSVPLTLDIFKTSNPTSRLHDVTSRVLIEIGGDEVGAAFLEYYRRNKAKMGESRKFDAMQELAMLQYAPAVKDAEEFLKIDPERYYWQVYFIFGLFDDLAVPMLCEKLNDSDALVRTNALGAIRFLMPESTDMTKALLKRMEVEKDPDIRYQLVETIEWNMIAQGTKGQQELRETFSRLLESEDKNSSAAKFMRETVASKSAMPAGMREKFKPDANKFNAAYKTILDNGVHLSYGQEAANDILYCATRKDVPKLKELRRRALYRQSDECFYDHKKLTRIINWVLAWAPETAP